MAKYRVYMETPISLAITVDVGDDLDEYDAREKAIERAFEEAPSGICAQCSGWGKNWSKSEGEYDIAKGMDGMEVQPEKVSE